MQQAAVETQQKLGNGMEAGVTQGPLINKSQHRWTFKYKNYWPREMSSIISNLHVSHRRKPSLRCPPPAKCVQWWKRQKQKVLQWWLEEKRAQCTENYIISEALRRTFCGNLYSVLQAYNPDRSHPWDATLSRRNLWPRCFSSEVFGWKG